MPRRSVIDGGEASRVRIENEIRFTLHISRDAHPCASQRALRLACDFPLLPGTAFTLSWCEFRYSTDDNAVQIPGTKSHRMTSFVVKEF